MTKYLTYGIPDEDFIRGNIPMTKEEIRTITISKLRLYKNCKVIDIGAGTGTISVEIARLLKDGLVISIEKNKEAVELIKKNSKKFAVEDKMKIIHGKAPEALNDVSNFDRVVIGGSGGDFIDILTWINDNIQKNGIIVINSITYETLNNSITFLENNMFNNIDIIQVFITKLKKVGQFNMFKSLNPIFIISAQKN